MRRTQIQAVVFIFKWGNLSLGYTEMYISSYIFISHFGCSWPGKQDAPHDLRCERTHHGRTTPWAHTVLLGKQRKKEGRFVEGFSLLRQCSELVKAGPEKPVARRVKTSKVSSAQSFKLFLLPLPRKSRSNKVMMMQCNSPSAGV